MNEEKALELHLNALEELPNMIAKAVERSRKDQHSRKQPTPSAKFNIGQSVYRYRANIQYSHSHKLASKWEGPFEIVEIFPKGAYKLRTYEFNPRILKNPVNGAHLQPCYSEIQIHQ
jgi:hypothetical protein